MEDSLENLFFEATEGTSRNLGHAAADSRHDAGSPATEDLAATDRDGTTEGSDR